MKNRINLGKLLFSIVMFLLYLEPINALSFDVDLSVNNKTIESGDKVKVEFKVTNIKDYKNGISSCEMNYSLSAGMDFATNFELLDNNWKYDKGKDKIIFYSTDNHVNDFKLFSTLIRVNDSGTITFSNIKCYGVSDDGNDEESYVFGEKDIFIEVKSEETNSVSEASSSSSLRSTEKKNDSSSKSSSSSEKSSSSLKPSSENSSSSLKPSSEITKLVYGFTIKGGTIDFDDDINNYKVYVSSFEAVDADPIVDDGVIVEKTNYLLDDEGMEYHFKVSDNLGNSEEYNILFVLDGSSIIASNSNVDTTGKTDYTIYFVIVIVILVGINVLRVISNKKKVLN